MKKQIISGTYILAVSVAVSSGIPACVGSTEYHPELDDTGKPALHAVHGQRLRMLMRRLDALMFERQRTHVQIARDRRTYLEQTISASEELLETIPYLVTSAEDLTEEDEAIYTALVDKLEAQVRALARLAAEGKAEVASRQYDAIVTTCNACHSTFRELAGEEP